jgi:GNAT superfamily N-acetyltransferase
MDQALIERLLTAATVEIAIIDPARAEARHCIHSYFAELDRRFDTGFDPSRTIRCGGLKFHGDQPAELKRMWVSDTARGLGIGRRLLTDLEQLAVKHGARTVRLETNGTLTEAISLYRSAGYVEVPAFNDEPYAHHWFEKRLSDYAHSTSPNRA